MNKLSLVFLLCFFSGVAAYSQVVNLGDNTGAPIREKKYSDVEGTPYLFDKWKKGELVMSDNKVKENVSIRYNIHEEQVEVTNNNQTLALFPSSIKEFTIHTHDENERRISYRFRNGFDINSYTKDDFFQVLYDGENKLIAKLKTQLVEGSGGSYGRTDRGSVFQHSKDYYLVKADGSAEKIRLNRRNLAKAFPEMKDEIKNIEKQNKLNLSDEAGVAALLMHLDNQS